MSTYACLACPEGKKRLAKIRGLCLACYQHANAAVREGRTTWATLAQAGKARLTEREAAGRKGGPAPGRWRKYRGD